jgi:hypothetical protein
MERLLRGFRLRDVAWLLKSEVLHSSIYILEPLGAEFVAVHPIPGSIPWPALLALGSYSRKFIFGPSRYNPRVINERLADFGNRLKWQVHLKDAVKSESRPLVKRRIKHCNGVMPAAVDAFIRNSCHFIRQCLRLVPRVSFRPPGFLAFTLKWLRYKNLRVEVSDKDGVFVVIPRQIAVELVQKELKKPCYRPVGTANLEPLHRAAQRDLFCLARLLDPISGVWAAEIRSLAAKSVPNDLLCRLQCTVKTHKQVVSARVIHSSTKSMFNAVGVLNKLLAPLLASCEQIATGSEEVVRKIKNTPVGPRSIMLKFDVQDFYLAGNQQLIAETVSSWFGEAKLRKFIKSALLVVLGFQFVGGFDYTDDPCTMYGVQRGSGIGMKHAGAVADACFAILAERPVLGLKEQLGVIKYVRFRDDVFVLLDDIKYTPAFKECFFANSSRFCKVVLESYSLVGATFLDLRISKPPSGFGFLQWQPYIKATARHLPLGSDSYHSWTCHRAWPRAEILRMHRRSSSCHLSKRWRQIKIDHFKRHMLHWRVIKDCSDWSPDIRSEISRDFLRCESGPVASIIRLILPYRHEIADLGKKFSRFASAWVPYLKLETGIEFKPQVSWSSSGPHLKSLLALNNHKSEEGRDGGSSFFDVLVARDATNRAF